MRAISIRMGLLMLASFVAFFLLMYILGLGERTELRLFNVVIQLFFLYSAIKAYYRLHPENVSNYLKGLAQGMGASVIGIGGFTILVTISLYSNPTLMETIRQKSQMGPYLNPFTTSLFIFAEGLIIGVIGSYIIARILEVRITKQEH